MNKSVCLKYLLGTVLLLFLTGCVPHSFFNEEYVSDEIQERSGYEMNSIPGDTGTAPAGVIIDDGLTREEAIILAFWNNPQLKVDLASLGFARADLIDAGMLPNPLFSLLFPLGPKQMEFTLSYYADVLWQRPARVSAARINVEMVAENLVSHGLAMIRDVNITFAEFDKLSEQAQIHNDVAELSNEIFHIASTRREVGDISDLEETAFQLEASQAKEAALIAKRNLELEKTKLLKLLGMVSEKRDIEILSDPMPEVNVPDLDSLIKIALAYRPDMRASELEIEMAGKKMGWERSKILNLTAILDANAQGAEGFEMGPGMALSIPIFNTNKGGRERARTEMIRSADNYIVVQQQIIGEVKDAWYSYLTSRDAYDMLIDDILPAAELASSRGESAYLAGEISYLEFLNFRRQFLNASLRLSNSRAEAGKSLANLYYSIGGELMPH